MKMERLHDLEDRVLNISAPMDTERVSQTKNVEYMADTVAAIVDMQKEVDREACEFLNVQREAMQFLNQIPPEDASVLIRRFFEDKSISEIAQIFSITRRQANRRITEAIGKLQHAIDEGEPQSK